MARARRPDGRIQIQYDMPPEPGSAVRKRKYFYGKTLKEANAKKDAWIQEQERQRRTSLDPDFLLSDWGFFWLDSIKGTISNGSYRNLYSSIRQQNKAMPDIRVCDVSPHHIQTYMSSLTGKSRSTISKRRYVLRAMLDYAVANRIIDRSPWQGIRVPHGTYTGHRMLTDAEKEAVLKGWPKCRAGIWALVMMYTGLRKEELCALDVNDIDFDTMNITVNKAAVLKENSRIKEPKTKAGYRTVPILPVLEKPLRSVCPASGRVFLSAHGEPINDTSFKRGWESMRNTLGVSFQAHDCRDTYASFLYDADVDVLTAAKLLGHDDISVTMGIYTKLSDSKERDAITRLRSYGCQMAVKSENEHDQQNPEHRKKP